MKGQGILRQIEETNNKYYTSLTVDTFNDFLDSLQKREYKENFVVPVGGFTSRMLTAYYNNDQVEIDKLNAELRAERINRYLKISKQTGLDYDIVFMLSTNYTLLNTFDSDVVWEVKKNWPHEDEYDDSYTCTEFRYHDGKFSIEEYYSDGWYETRRTKSEEVNKDEIFNKLINTVEL
jgi:hypothetical protein